MGLTLTPETESRVLAVAVRRNQAPEAVIDAALEALQREEPAQEEVIQADEETAYQERQAHLRRLLLAATEEAKPVQPEPPDSPTRTYYRNHPFAEGVAEKLRRQGFDVE